MSTVKELVQEKPKVIRKQLIRIMPFLNPDSDNMGLTAQKMVIMDGVKQKESLTYLEPNKGVRRYLSGLNEFAPEIQTIRDKEAKDLAIMEIRKKVQFLERTLGGNEVALEDENFMQKVKLVHPNNYEFWDTIFIECGNEPEFLNPEDPNGLIRICGIEARGFSLVSPSYEDAKMSANPPKWYLDKNNETAGTKVEIKRIKNQAATLLNTMSDKDLKKLFYVIKNIDLGNSYQYRNSTSPDIIYNWLDEYITGNGGLNAKKAAEEFIRVAKISTEDLRINAVVADAHFYKSIYAKSDGLLYHAETDSRLGRNSAELLSYFKDPLNSQIWDQIRTDIEGKWND